MVLREDLGLLLVARVVHLEGRAIHGESLRLRRVLRRGGHILLQAREDLRNTSRIVEARQIGGVHSHPTTGNRRLAGILKPSAERAYG
ncbi:MAG: hypothetical protein RIT81_21800 [Deltaproteobacteria bacterium]